MKNNIAFARGSLVVALVLAGISSCVCAVGYIGAPFKQIETRAELLKNQSSGAPISDADIDTHLGRLDSSRRAYGVSGVFMVAAQLAIVVALGLLLRRDSAK